MDATHLSGDDAGDSSPAPVLDASAYGAMLREDIPRTTEPMAATPVPTESTSNPRAGSSAEDSESSDLPCHTDTSESEMDDGQNGTATAADDRRANQVHFGPLFHPAPGSPHAMG